jgi:hypothetical protein
MAGIQTAGPKLTPQSFLAGMRAVPPQVDPSTPSVRTILTYGDHGLWPGYSDDPGGADNVGLLYWDPNATGEDETGAQGVGEYRVLNNGARYTASNFPTTPLPFFNPAGTATSYPEGSPPADLQPPKYPVPADAPNPNKGG